MNEALKDPSAMLALLARWTERRWLRELDLALVRFFLAEVPAIDPALMLATALVSHQLGRGHVCLDLAAVLDDPYMVLSLPPDETGAPDDEALPLPSDLLAGWRVEDWCARLGPAELVERTGIDTPGTTPLVLNGGRLYLRRYWRYERLVERVIGERMAASPALASQLPPERCRETLNALFPPVPGARTDWQKIACALAARSAFCIVTGGPGTGKTTTVVRLLALLQSLALADASGQALEIRLAAPTGKAAARLKASIAGAIDSLPAFVQACAPLKAAIPNEVTTLHRLLGPRPDSRQFRHNARNPLPLDVLVIDEGSMVDLEMMAAVLGALPAHARLVLLGDKDQLASVEAGSVLGELCRRAEHGHFLPETAHWLGEMTGETIDAGYLDAAGTPLDQHIVMLRESHRFNANSGIGQLARAVNGGDPAAIHRVRAAGYRDLRFVDLASLDDPRLESVLLGPAGETEGPQGFAGYLQVIRTTRPAQDAERSVFDDWAARVLAAHARFQLLCVLRAGPFGVSGMNQTIEALLRQRQLIDPSSQWYEGRPVIVTRNDYGLGLMNGDIGIALQVPVRDKTTGRLVSSLRVAFPRSDGRGGVRWVLPSRLVSVDTVFALTVHKSQGSEFEHCALILPPERNPVLTRELIYTGITRAKSWFSLLGVGHPRMLDDAAKRTVQRSGGLFA